MLPAPEWIYIVDTLFKQLCLILQISFTLLDPALVAGLVLGTTQLVRAGVAEGLGVDIAGIAPDGVLDMAALRLGRLQDHLQSTFQFLVFQNRM